MKVKIVTPYGTVFDRESDFVSFRTVEGAMGILPRRAPIITQLSVCDVTSNLVKRSFVSKLQVVFSCVMEKR